MEFMKPADIERESMAIIARTLDERGITLREETAHIVKRVIHTTADFDYADNLFFSEDVTRHAKNALSGGTIITDTNMALAGINKAALMKHGCSALCFMAEPFIAEKAAEDGTTRAAAAMDYAAAHHPGAVFVTGNAPTALMRLCDHIERGLRPLLVIGVPVGFVNVVESKDRAREVCTRLGIPVIISHGRKGGSNVAASVCNALLYGA